MFRVPLILAAAPVLLFAAVALSADAPAGDWQDVYSTEAWYKEFNGKEQVFKGKLEAIPNADGPSTLQRPAYYRLGARTIYRAKKHPALEKLVGKQVEIRGKPYDINLEGQAVSEIWPAAVRPAPPGK
jgi:hypothetical protein